MTWCSSGCCRTELTSFLQVIELLRKRRCVKCNEMQVPADHGMVLAGGLALE